MILFPTRGRPWALKRFIRRYKETGATTKVCVIVDDDQLDLYRETWNEAPAGFVLYPAKTTRDLNAAINAAVRYFPHEPFYGMVADDVVPRTDGWDKKLGEACQPHFIAWPDDGIWGAKHGKMELPTHPWIGGDLVRSWGWFSPPYTNRHCADFIWWDFAEALNIGRPCPDVLMEHLHWHIDSSLYDTTYATQPASKIGHDQYWHGYKDSEQFKKDLERVKERLGI